MVVSILKVPVSNRQYLLLMAPHENIHEYYLHQHRNIEHFLGLCLDCAESETVHELRLSIKKLRAFNKLAERLCLSDTDEHIFIKHRVRQLYKLAGQLRDTQVQMRLLAQFEELDGTLYPEFRKWLIKRERKRMARFGRKPRHVMPHATAHITHQKIGQKLALATDETIVDSAGKVMGDLFDRVRQLSRGNICGRDLHRTRIILKQVRYILNFIQLSYPEFVFASLSVDAMLKIEVASGRWHDSLVRVELLGKFINTVPQADNVIVLKYKKLLGICNSLMDNSFHEACRVVKAEIPE